MLNQLLLSYRAGGVPLWQETGSFKNLSVAANPLVLRSPSDSLVKFSQRSESNPKWGALSE